MPYKCKFSEEEIEKTVLSDINMDSSALELGVQHLIEWTRKQLHIPQVTDIPLLKAFIIGSKSVERAKERLDKYYIARTKYPVAFANRDPRCIPWNNVQKVVILPGLIPTGEHILMFICPNKAELESYQFIDTAKVLFYLFDMQFRTCPLTSGQYLICDYKNITMEFLTKFITSFTNAAFDIYQNTLPIRIKGMICFNVTPVAELFVNNIIKPLLSSKIQERVHAHREDHTILSKYFPLDILPEEYGGKNPSVQQIIDDTKMALEKERDWFMTEGSKGADLAKRPKTDYDENQLQGTFRKLELD